MTDLSLPWMIFPLFFVIAALYSSVGQGGASGYLAVFALFGIASPAVPPAALSLNTIVATLSFLVYKKSGFFSARLFMPFAVSSVPAAFVGALIPLSRSAFALVLGLALFGAALMTIIRPGNAEEKAWENRRMIWLYGGLAGLVLGLLSGMTGLGGGVFLGPVILLAGWANIKRTAAVCSAFIMVNSVSGLAGHILRGNFQFEPVLQLAAVVIAGGLVGAFAGARRIKEQTLRVVLAMILLVASIRILVG